jgi:catechol 2,3-dioxygenase-like lactoylglutathione lyase family enzyme
MISKMSHVSIFVPDQEAALLFYTNILGFKLHTDAAFGDTRWLTLYAPDAPDFELCLMQGNPPQTAAPVGAFITNDCRGTYQELSAKGVNFFGEPKEEDWGIGVAFADLAGNIFYLNQPK